MKTALFSFVLGLSAAGLLAQEPSPSPSPAATFPAQIEQVNVDAVVTDKKGNPIRGLTRDSFVVMEDGKPQNVSTFEAIELPAEPPAAAPPRPRVSSNTAPEVRTGRSFVVVFDDIHLTPFQAHRAKGAVGEFLTSAVREGDRVTLVATGGAAWWSTRMMSGKPELLTMLKRLDGRNIPDSSPERMTDHEAMRIHIYRDPQVMERVKRRFESYGVTQLNRTGSEVQGQGFEDPFVTGRATEVYYQATSRMRITLEVLERVLDSLATTKGRKSLILVSQGFVYDPNVDEFKRVVQASRRGNAAIYFLDTRGLDSMPVALSAQFGPPIDNRDLGALFSENIEASEGAESIASDSGGFSVKNQNDLGRGIRRIADESRAYYMLGYSPTNTARDGKFRKIEVKVAMKGVQVRARKGYYAPAEGRTALDRKPKTVDPDIQAALDSPFDVEEIPLRMTAFVFDETLLGKASTIVATEVDIRGFAFEEQEGRFFDTLEFLLVVAHRETGEFFRYDQKIDMKLLPATRERMGNTWFPMTRDFELKPGGYQAKIVVRDKNSGRVGTVVHEFDVPDLGSFRVSTPVISDTTQPRKEGETGVRPALVVRRDFHGGIDSVLFCSVEVYGAAKDKKTGMPEVTMGYRILRPDGTTLTQVSPTLIRPTSLGKLSRMLGTSLEWATAGDYELILSFKDQLADKTLELREPFSVAGAAPASGGS